MHSFKNIIICVTALAFLLTGCMFPQEERAENRIPYEAQLQTVQQAVDQYRKDNNVLPIKTTEEDTPIYQKYMIDFNQLIPRYMQQPPGNSFENGGIYQYVIIDPEEQPTVKVLDLSVMNEVQKLQRAINAYIEENEYAPIKDTAGPEIFEIDLERLDYNGEAKVESPYQSDTTLPLLMNENGEVRIDYAIDLHIALQEFDHELEKGDDIRRILVDNYPIAPAFSVPYTVNDNNEPIFKEH
ncbi:DUF3939 domain-containing protein [Salibacterium aidingense]|uniref:DUF3939 domain-containing protein n=1 Tax=Salibacterium aidingense TaxID=384933 RepID=UPI000416CB88|nr:DUF3939 domain-containing protein [Salibacterium aidingense]